MKTNIKITILIGLVFLLITGCATDQKKAGIKPMKEVPQMKLSQKERQTFNQERFELPEEFEKNIKEFSARITSQYFSQAPSNNALISPISIRYAFSTLSEGADGKTAELFANFIHEKLDQTFSKNNKMHKQFLNTMIEDEQSGSKLVVKDSLWIDDSVTLKKNFIEKAAEDHFAQVYHANLGDQNTAEAINQWVKEATNNLIDPKKEPDDQLKLLILNTIYFKEGWSNPFEVSLNTKEEFTQSDGSKKQVEYMHSKELGREMSETQDYYIAQLSFANGSSFRVLLPKEGKNLKELMKDGKEYDLIYSLLSSKLEDTAHINWQVPKFTFASEIDLKKLMSEMGYKELFDENADFSELSETRLFISDAKQLTNFILNNEGVEAAAYTEIAMKESSAMISENPKEIDMKLNKPFLYSILLRDGTPLFIGMMNEAPVTP